MQDIDRFLKKFTSEAFVYDEYLIGFALEGWMKSVYQFPSEWMADLKTMLKQYKGGKSAVVDERVKECLEFIDEWFHRTSR